MLPQAKSKTAMARAPSSVPRPLKLNSRARLCLKAEAAPGVSLQEIRAADLPGFHIKQLVLLGRESGAEGQELLGIESKPVSGTRS